MPVRRPGRDARRRRPGRERRGRRQKRHGSARRADGAMVPPRRPRPPPPAGRGRRTARATSHSSAGDRARPPRAAAHARRGAAPEADHGPPAGRGEEPPGYTGALPSVLKQPVSLTYRAHRSRNSPASTHPRYAPGRGAGVDRPSPWSTGNDVALLGPGELAAPAAVVCRPRASNSDAG